MIGAGALFATALIHIGTFFPVNGDFLAVGQFALIAPMFVVFAGGLLAVIRGHRRIEIPDGGPGLAIAVGFFALFIYTGINFFITRLPGQPVNSDGTFYFNVHGSRVAISREQYEEALRLQVRLITGDLLVFLAAGTALLLATLRSREAAATQSSLVVFDFARNRIEVVPRARLWLGVAGVATAIVLDYWLLWGDGPIQGGAAMIWAVAVLAITLFNVVRYWRWLASGRADLDAQREGAPPGRR